ncbi:Hint domain-containing protein [Lacimonas salitolerans]|uniref:Hint domain-containing protein n=1 Tax=Lacimonas salitolerans TaxID=1323750 RepID=A0ABW4EFJ8_9RHOB
MADRSFLALGISDLIVSGPDPFDSNSRRETDAFNQTTLRLAPGVEWTRITMTDDDPELEDGDGAQELTVPATFNGNGYTVGQSIEIEYSYLIRPFGSTDPATFITIYVLEFGTQVQGITTSQRLSENVTYQIIDGGSNDPKVLYTDLVVCFTPGVEIATPRGPVAVQALRPGDRVCTVDNGPQPLVWIGGQVARGVGAAMPVAVSRGVLGNARDLLLSPQHRVIAPRALGLGADVLVPVKALVGLPGVCFAPYRQVAYLHLLFDAHQLLLAEGAPVESFLPGPQALKSLPRTDRQKVSSLFPTLGQRCWAAARPTLRPGKVRRQLMWSAHRAGGVM